MKCKELSIRLTLMGLFLLFQSPLAFSEVITGKPSPSPVVKKKYRVLKTKPRGASTVTVPTQEKARDKKATALQVWLNKMKKRIAGAETKHNKLVAVASVRGDDSADAPPLYWKGKTSQGPVGLPELKEFEDAVNLALNGDKAGSTAKLQSFVSAYPNSPLQAEAQETLNALAAEVPVP